MQQELSSLRQDMTSLLSADGGTFDLQRHVFSLISAELQREAPLVSGNLAYSDMYLFEMELYQYFILQLCYLMVVDTALSCFPF